MRKEQLVAAVAARTGLSKAKARDAVVALFGNHRDRPGIITSELVSGSHVHIADFGTFGTCRDPGSRPYFHPARSLRQRIEKPQS